MHESVGGDSDWWTSLLSEQSRQHARLFFQVAMRVLRDPSAAEDAVQAAFLKALQRPADLRMMGNVRAWLCQIVYRDSLLILRRRKTDTRHVDRSAGDPGPVHPGERAVDLREAVQAALDRLPEATRLIVSLRMLDGWSGNKVAELLDCSASEVSRHLHEGMKRLRELMADWD